MDGKTLLKEQLSGALDEGERLGVVLAEKLLAQGAGELLKALY